MTAKEIHDIFISILRSELTETKLDTSIKEKLTPDVLAELYVLSSQQALTGMVAACLSKEKLLADDLISKRFKNSLAKALYRVERMKLDLSNIEEAFVQGQIPYIPLKGAIIRKYYPQECFRTSSDIDILIKEEDIERSLLLLKERGFDFKERTYHDISIFTPQNNHLELHFSILEANEKLDTILKNVWKYSYLQDGSRYVFSKEFFMFHFFAHMVNHFITSGCGIRFLCDLWVVENRMGIKLDDAKSLLKKAGIYTFAKEMERISHICFDEEKRDEMSESIILMMLSGGTCGSEEISAAMSVATNKADSKIKFVIKRLFPKFSTMKETYPVLKKAPFLLPFLWIYRIVFKLCNGKGKSAANEIKSVKAVSAKDVEIAKDILNHLDL